jgi:hypothetical protein
VPETRWRGVVVRRYRGRLYADAAPEPVPPPLHPGTKQPVTLADDGRDYDAVAAAREGALSDAA